VRRQRLGYLPEPLPVAGRPAGWWLTLFFLSHREAGGGWERLAWPDGGPLLDQSWPLVLAFEAIGDECRRVWSEAARQGARGRRGA
jgi:hypothetical protein